MRERGVDPVRALGGEARAEQVERVGGCCGDGAGQGAGEEGFEGGGELCWERVQGCRRLPVGRELDAAVEDVEGFGGDVAFPEALGFRWLACVWRGRVVWRRTVMPSSRRMVWNVDRAP